MKFSFNISLLLFSILHTLAYGQSGIIQGRIFDQLTNEPIPFANIAIQNTRIGAVSDIEGLYRISNLEPGLYNVQATYVGFDAITLFEIEVFAQQPTTQNIGMVSNSTQLEAIEISTSVFERNADSPISLQKIGTNEIQRNPGGNRDISKALQVLPGVSSSLSFRNDIIIRGGAPNENRFYLDGVEVPVINHFSTQGASGGPVGILNVNFIESVDFYSGAFPANRGNALSSVLQFNQKDGNPDKLRTNFTLGASDVGLTFDGPVGSKTSFIVSARRSYLQFLFSLLGLPFLPTYNDAQIKIRHRFNQKNELTFIGLGAYDTFRLNLDAVANAETQEEEAEARYVLGNIPVNNQWNYTLGANYKHFSKNGFQNLVISRSSLNNESEKYQDNNRDDADALILKYVSTENENKLRFEHTQRFEGWKVNAGLNLEDVTYTNSTFNKVTSPGGVQIIDFDSKINFQKFGAFFQGSRNFFDEKLILSAGLRSDWNSYSNEMAHPMEQLSPRVSLSYSLLPGFTFNASVGRYFQLPPYTVLGFRNNSNTLVNAANGVRYIQADHYVAGFQYILKSNTKISIEGFHKVYDQYPFTLRDSINLANLGGDFGVIGNEEVLSIGRGRTYGLEILIQRKLYKNLYGIAALTFVRSEFTDKRGDYIPSAWDNRFILNLTAGRKFSSNWEVGTRLRLLGGTPYTPFDLNQSSQTAIWDVRGQGVLNNSLLNTERNPVTYQLDLRIDKKYFFSKWSLNIYLDIQNATNATFNLQPNVDVQRNTSGDPLVDQSDSSRYLLTRIPNTVGQLLPTVGVVVEF